MIRLTKLIFLIVLGFLLVTVLLANRNSVELRGLPDVLANVIGLPNMIVLPLYLVIFGAVVLGLALGYLWEWLREYRLRAEGAKAKREADQLHRKVRKMQRRSGDHDDDVIALIEGNAKQ